LRWLLCMRSYNQVLGVIDGDRECACSRFEIINYDQ